MNDLISKYTVFYTIVRGYLVYKISSKQVTVNKRRELFRLEIR